MSTFQLNKIYDFKKIFITKAFILFSIYLNIFPLPVNKVQPNIVLNNPAQ